MKNLRTPCVILVDTEGSGNIGSVARTCAAFGLDSFRLVSPRCELDHMTEMFACYGKRVLDKIRTFQDLPAALTDVDVAVALTRQDGKSRHRHYDLSDFAERVVPELAPNSRVALVFGNEKHGLTNHHLRVCRFSAEIPVVACDGSLNLAHAVSIALYELVGRKRHPKNSESSQSVHQQKADALRLRSLFELCAEVLESVGYPSHDSSLESELTKLKTIISDGRLRNWEVRALSSMVKEVARNLCGPILEDQRENPGMELADDPGGFWKS